MTAYWPRLHRQIHANFTLEDVRTLCFNLSVDFDDLAGEGKTAIIWSLLRHLFDHKRIPDLLAELRRKRPSIPWPNHDPTIPFFQPDPKRAGARQELPQGLRLKLFEVSGAHYDEIVFVQRQVPLYTDYRFGLALLNPFQEQLAVTGVLINLQASWDGEIPEHAPKVLHNVNIGRSSEWDIRNQKIFQVGEEPRPAILFYYSDTKVCAYGHPVEWSGFCLRLREVVSGRFLLNYTVTSIKPETRVEGELRIVMLRA